MASSEFARKQLEKHGWKKGSGLGREEHGRADPIKVVLKMDKAGVGHDPGKEFTDHWWLRAFNDAAKKIGTGTKKQEESAESKKQKEMTDRKARFYAGFVKSSVLTDGVEEKDKDAVSSSEDETPQESLPTLDDLHKLCGGATGHRAAMFGIKMRGKLGRVAAHDKMFEEKVKSQDESPEAAPLENVGCEDTAADTSSDRKSAKRKKKKKKCKDEDASCLEEGTPNVKDENVDVLEEGSSEAEPKKKKRKKRKRAPDDALAEGNEIQVNSEDVSRTDTIEEITVSADVAEGSDHNSSKAKRKKKSKRSSSDDVGLNVEQTIDSQGTRSKKKRRHKTKGDEDEAMQAVAEVEEGSTSSLNGKGKKKRKGKRMIC